MNISCETCAFYDANQDNHCQTGKCRLNPPTVYPNPIRKPITNEVVMSQIQFLPVVDVNFFCGQYQPKEEIRIVPAGLRGKLPGEITYTNKDGVPKSEIETEN